MTINATVSYDVTNMWQCDLDITLTLTIDPNKEYSKKKEKERKRKLNKETSIQASYVWQKLAEGEHKFEIV